jgi:prolyl oligopeptidase
VDELHGRKVADPYRWLEDAPDDWVAGQSEAAARHLAELPERRWFRRVMTAVVGRPTSGVPLRQGGWYLVRRNDGSQQQDVLCVARSMDELVDGGRVIADPNSLSSDGSLSIYNFSVSADGRYLAYGTMTDGNPGISYRLVQLITGDELDDAVTDAKYYAATWLPDCSSYVYYHLAAGADAIGGQLKVHRVGTPQADDLVVLGFPPASQTLVEVKLSHDGQYLVAHLNESTDQRRRLWVYPVRTADGLSTLGEPVRLIDEAVANTRFVRTTASGLVLWTDLDAPRGRIVGCSLQDPSFKDLIPETDHPIIAVSAAGDGLITVSLADVQPLIELHREDGTKTRLDLAGGAVVAVNGTADKDEVFIGLSSTTTPTEVSEVNASTSEVRRLRSAVAEFEAPAVTVLRQTAPGREVPYFLITRADLDHSSPRPTLLYGYGGFNSAQLADYRPGWPAWLAAGGVLVIANLRGGGEFGAEWHDAGRLERKQNTFDDCIAVAEHLNETGITTPAQLALHGHSGGGMLVGAVITQRPELFAVALPSAGVMDMLRFHLFTIGRAWIPEIGSPDDADHFDYLLAYSPLHNLHVGTAYPATLVQTSDHDEIVVPLHSYKFAAALQHAQAADAPILLRVQSKAGHGPGRASAAIAAEWADRLAFAAHHTGLDPAYHSALDPRES